MSDRQFTKARIRHHPYQTTLGPLTVHRSQNFDTGGIFRGSNRIPPARREDNHNHQKEATSQNDSFHSNRLARASLHHPTFKLYVIGITTTTLEVYFADTLLVAEQFHLLTEFLTDLDAISHGANFNRRERTVRSGENDV